MKRHQKKITTAMLIMQKFLQIMFLLLINKKKIASDIISQNLDKSLLWHYNNLKINNMFITKNEIKKILQDLREINYQNDNSFLIDISKIKISFNDNNNELNNLPFCYFNNTIYNEKSKKQEKYVLFTSSIQIKKIDECEKLYMDGTFHCSPKNYYQLFNIIWREKKTGILLPLIFILMTSKSFFLYQDIFENIKTLLSNNNISIDFKKVFIMMDFEKGARKAIKKVFPKCKLLGCYFHYTKALWNKAKKQGLFKKEIFKDTYTLIFSLKIYVFIPTEEKKEYLERLKNLYKEKRQFKSFLYYFEKYWSVNDFLNFEDCDRTDFIARTDNACENFHNNLNKLVGISHPKISFLIDKIKIYTKGQFDKLIDCLLLKNENIQKSYSVYEDIFNFTKKIKNK